MDQPKISIITPTLNSVKTIEECLLSVAKQSYPNKEHLIIDGLSRDGTLKIVQEYAARCPHIRFISEKDTGIYAAMNKGIDLSTGQWILFLGSDDVFSENNMLSDIFQNNAYERYGAIYGNIRLKNSNQILGGKFSALRILCENIPHQAIFYKKRILDTFSMYCLEYPIYADWDLNLKLFQKKIPVLYTGKTVAIFNENGFSGNSIDRNFMDYHRTLLKKYPLSIRIKVFFARWYYRARYLIKYPSLALRILRLKCFRKND